MRMRIILAMFGLVASTFAVFTRIMNPTAVQVIIEGNTIELTEIPSIYNSFDMVVTGISCFVLGSSLIYLLLVGKNKVVGKDEPSLMRSDWNKILDRLSNPDERKIIQLIIDEGGTIFQSQLIEKSGYSKSKVSLVLDRLEARRILERRRHGMSNVVVLK
jgi:hypothetical protein